MDFRLEQGFTLKEALNMVYNDGIIPVQIYMEPPEPNVLTDEDSGDEDDGALVDNLNIQQLRSHVEIVFPDNRWYLAEVGIQIMEWSTCSPDLNPIEHSRNTLKRRVQARNAAPITLPQLKNMIQEEWDNIPQEVVNNLIRPMIV
ncbi:hypothetical protein JTB14_015549 [Gonioctena quinquepunctata]|nr:hypothetical protein JTB14_015549 [Gonioctena quinquepunctata]